MTVDDRDSEDEIVQSVLPVEVVEPAIPIELNKTFPWHRPRKQFVRERQWIAYSKTLIERIRGTAALPSQLDGTKEVKYLSLPGIDYLDVQLLGECCKELGCTLTNTGYLATSERNPIQARANLREAALIETGHISLDSQTYPRRLEEISHTSSSAYRELQTRGPFHIVNIDACGSVAPPDENRSQRMIDAIYRIVEFQLETYSGRWLLFLTADVRPERFHDETFAKLIGAIIQNAEQSDDFQNEARNVFGDGVMELPEALNNAKQDEQENYIKLFSLGFSKWILHLAQHKGWEMKMHNSYFYSTDGADSERPTMPCLAFEFVPPDPGLDDPHNVAQVAPTPGGMTEDTSLRAAKKTDGMIDLDRLIAEEEELSNALGETTKDLLRKIGYAETALANLGNPDFDVVEP